MSQPVDQVYLRAMEFAKRFKKKHPNHLGISNLYVIQKVDLEGNVTEYYGMNLLTDYGMSQYFVAKQPFPTNIYFGNGSGSFNYTSNSLISPISSVPATVSDSSHSYAYPLYYSGENAGGIITCVCRWLTAYIPYVWDNITTAITISEYGIGDAVTYSQQDIKLWTHSWVYDNHGNKTTITKTPQEQLIITVYFCMSYTEQMINDAWDAGKYIVITTPYRFALRNTVTMEEESIQTYKRYGVNAVRTKSNVTSSAFQDNIITLYTNMENIIVQPGDTATTGYVDGAVSWTPGMNMLERMVLDHDVAFDAISLPNTTYFAEPDAFSYNFGLVNFNLPFTQANVTNSYTYNYLTGDYTCADVYLQTANRWYTETFMETTFATPLRYINNNNIETIYVYRNLKTDDPIMAIRGAITTVYATDKYWDSSTWILITDLANVPAAARTKKYWLSSSNTVNLDPVRASQSFTYIGWNNQAAQTLPYDTGSQMRSGFYQTVGNYDQSFFIVGKRIYNMKSGVNTTIDINSDTGVMSKILSYVYGNHIVSFANDSTAYFKHTYMGDPTPVPVSVQNVGGITNSWWSHVTESNTGYLIQQCYYNSQIWKTIKIDLTGTTLVQTALSDAVDATALWGTNTYAYIDATDQRVVYVKSLVDDSLIQTFTVPSSKAVAKNVFGWRDKLYVTDGSTYTYLCDVTTGTLTACTGPNNLVLYNGYVGYQTCSCVDDCMIVYNREASGSMGYALIVQYSDPSTIIAASPLNIVTSSSSYVQVNLKKLNTNTIVMIIQTEEGYSGHTGYTSGAIDLGKFLKTGTIAAADKFAVGVRFATSAPWVVYGDYLIRANKTFPIANVIPHRFVGTTRTVCAVDTYKSISGKQWQLSVTNISSWNGKPPGTQQ